MQKIKIAVLISGGGTNLQSIIDAIESRKLENCEIVLVISSKEKAFGLQRAKEHGIFSVWIGKGKYENPSKINENLMNALIQSKADLIVLAGYLSILPKEIIEQFSGRIINVHPSLIPKYCGEGFYGERVHKAVLENNESISGATVHYVDEGVDTGEIILSKSVPVLQDDTVETLSSRVLEIEHEILVSALKNISEKMFVEKSEEKQ